jgi:putative endonuclease
MPLRGYLYILLCSDGSYYVGHTSNLELRMWEHQHAEGGDYTSRRLPVKLVFSEELPTVHDAFLAERQVKGWSRAKKKAVIRRDFQALVELSKNRQTL